MTANLYEKHSKYHVMLSWYQGNKRKQKSVATGISVKGNNKRSAEAERRRILAEWESKITENFQDILLSDYLRQWLKTAKQSVAETTYSSYKAAVEKQICPYFDEKKIKLHELKPHHIKAFYTWKMENSNVTGNTIRRYHANIHKALREACESELIPRNPAANLILPKYEEYVSDFYTVEELRKLLNVIKGEKLETVVMLSIQLGTRRGETLGIQYKDCDFEEKKLYIRGTVTDKGEGSRTENLKYRSCAKTKSSIRSFPMTPELADYLRALILRQDEYRKLAGDSYNQKWNGFVNVDEQGNLLTPEYVSRAFPKLLEKNNLRRIRLHELRDSNASLLLANGVDLVLIQSWLGHANLRTTTSYAKHRIDAKQPLGEVVSRALS